MLLYKHIARVSWIYNFELRCTWGNRNKLRKQQNSPANMRGIYQSLNNPRTIDERSRKSELGIEANGTVGITESISRKKGGIKNPAGYMHAVVQGDGRSIASRGNGWS